MSAPTESIALPTQFVYFGQSHIHFRLSQQKLTTHQSVPQSTCRDTMRKKVAPLKGVWDITPLVNVTGPTEVITDGRKKNKASTFRVQVHCDAFESRSQTCFLKTVCLHHTFTTPNCCHEAYLKKPKLMVSQFLPNAMNTEFLTAESSINHLLHSSILNSVGKSYMDSREKTPSIQELKDLIQLVSQNQSIAWPTCYGALTITDPFTIPSSNPSQPPCLKPRARKPPPAPPTLQALLFEFIPNLTPLLEDHLDDSGFTEDKVMDILAQLHKARVHHHDLLLRAAWPNFGLNNLFWGDGKVWILDFDHSRIMREQDEVVLKEEKEEIRETMRLMKENRGRDMTETLSKEAQRLLG